MYPTLLKIGFIHIYSYGLMVGCAFFISAFLLSERAARAGFKEDFFWNLCFWALIGGIAGGRLAYIILNFQFFRDNPQEILMLWHGGLVWYGGLLGGILCALFYVKLKKKSIGKVLDELAPFVALGHSIGRIGCFLNGCCYGRPAAWGIYFPVHNDYLIPVQLFSSLNLLAVFIILRVMQERARRQGFVFVAYLLLSSLERFLMEFLRNDSAPIFYGLTVFQIISAAIFLITLCLWTIILLSRKKKPASV
jgi:phosphatidylglycerol---prolipoprotein diacylglyceryl transferase